MVSVFFAFTWIAKSKVVEPIKFSRLLFFSAIFLVILAVAVSFVRCFNFLSPIARNKSVALCALDTLELLVPLAVRFFMANELPETQVARARSKNAFFKCFHKFPSLFYFIRLSIITVSSKKRVIV